MYEWIFLADYNFFMKFAPTKNIRDGFGRLLSIVIKLRQSGKCPWRAPTKQSREEVMMWQLKLPRADVATSRGIMKAAAPIILSAYVWKLKKDI